MITLPPGWCLVAMYEHLRLHVVVLQRWNTDEGFIPGKPVLRHCEVVTASSPKAELAIQGAVALVLQAEMDAEPEDDELVAAELAEVARIESEARMEEERIAKESPGDASDI